MRQGLSCGCRRFRLWGPDLLSPRYPRSDDEHRSRPRNGRSAPSTCPLHPCGRIGSSDRRAQPHPAPSIHLRAVPPDGCEPPLSRATGNERKVQVKIVVVGGTGLIGSRLVTNLIEHGHDITPASPRLGINAITGEGLAAALDGASVVVDVSNSPTFEYPAALEFFERSTHNLLAAERAARVGHHVALSVVGTHELWQNGDPTKTTAGYFRAKQTQEEVIAASGIPYSIVHATQFFEFIKSIADQATVGETVHVPPVLLQPMAADDVASGVGPCRRGCPRERRRRDRRAGAVPVRRAGSARARRRERPARGPHRPSCGLLRDHRHRAHARARGRRPSRGDPTGRLAPPVRRA